MLARGRSAILVGNGLAEITNAVKIQAHIRALERIDQ